MKMQLRKSKLFWAVALIVFILLVVKGPGYVKNTFFDQFTDRKAEPVLAVFDRQDAANTRLLRLPHYTVYWKSTAVKSNNFDGLLKLLKQNDALLTIETWPESYIGPWTTDALAAIQKGDFDRQITDLAKLVNQTKHSVYVRFNPDMEVPVHQFAWQYQSSREYSKAFNYLAAKLKRAAPGAKLVWGPSGFPGDTEFWPGHQYVDAVSITLGSHSESSSAAYPYQPQLPAMLFTKLHRMRFINKPVLVIGGYATAKNPFKLSWLKEQQEIEKRYDTTVYSPKNFVAADPEKPVRQQIKVGVFDPNRRLVNNPCVSVEHLFTDWGEIQRGDFKLKFDSVLSRHHDAVVTVEPWRDTSKRPDNNVLLSTLNGRYDQIIQKLYQIISNCGQTVYLRFAHEMEIPIHRYAWQSKDPAAYISAFRYFMQADKIHAKNIRRVWGPAGDRGSADWWPGSDVVDYISIAIYGLPDKNITDPNKQEPFDAIFERKFYRMRFLNRPLFITEFGVKGDEAYQRQWLTAAAQTIRNNKHVFGICYFNLYDNPKAWGNIKAPDWSISPENMKIFCEQLTK